MLKSSARSDDRSCNESRSDGHKSILDRNLYHIDTEPCVAPYFAFLGVFVG